MPTLTCEIIPLEEYEGSKARVYSVYVEAWDNTLYDRFLDENAAYEKELAFLENRIELMATVFGVREDWLKRNEGPPDLQVVALFDNPGKKLRCYGIQFGKVLLILGGGGPKPKGMRRFQESEKLTDENSYLQQISRQMNAKMANGTIRWSEDGMDLTGDMQFTLEVQERE